MQPRDEESTPELEALLSAAASLSVDLPLAHVDALVARTLGPPKRRRWPIVVALAAAAALALFGWFGQRSSVALADVAGLVAVNGHAASAGDAVPQGAVVETGVDATARLPLDGVDVTLAPNSRLVLAAPLELRAGVAFVRGGTVKLKVGSADALADGEVFVIAEPQGELDRVTAQLAVPETEMRPLLLSLMLPAVALGGSTAPAVVVRAGAATLNDSGQAHDVKAGGRWSPPSAPAPGANDALAAQVAALTAEQAALRKRLETLEAKSGTSAVPVPTSAAPVRGTVVDPLGHPAAGVAVMMFAGDRLGEPAYTDASGRFSLEPPADAEGVVYAHKDGRCALQASARPGTNVALQLVEPGKIAVQTRLNGAPTTGKVTAWTSSAHLAAGLPGQFRGGSYTGDHSELTRPAGELVLHLEAEDPHAAAHVPVRVEPGRTISVTVELQLADAVVHGRVVDAATHRPLKNYEVQLLLPDDTLEAGYTSQETMFGFGNRTAGERVILVIADGYKPLRARVTLEPGKTAEMGSLALQAL